MTKIQNNKISFIISTRANANERQYLLMNGEFHIKDHKITTSQSNDIKNDDTLHCDKNGEFNFRIGRKPSEDVANWFNEKCNPNTNATFGHPVKKLNFAMNGTLRLKISQINSVNEEFEIEFNDIVIAQGVGNNWCLGGENCVHISNDTILSKGSTKNQNNFRFTFLSGGNTVEIIKIEFFTWMKMIDENRFLSQINIPGTHDSATYKFNKLIFSNYVKTQNLSIRQQLDFGIRFLDIRCRHINNKFAIHHARYYCNLMFDEVLDQCISFLRDNESECIVMLMNEEHEPKGNTREFYQTFSDYVDNKNTDGDYWYRKNTIPRLKEARKKIVLLYRFNFRSQSFGINVRNWANNQTFKITNANDLISLWIQDEYSVSWSNKSKTIKRLIEESNKRENYWYLNYISLSPSALATIRGTANFMNGVIDRIAKNNRDGFLGLIIMDYPNSKKGLTAAIIDNNKHFYAHLYPRISIYGVENLE